MLFKFFTEKETNISVAVNPNNVLSVKEIGIGTTIYFNNSSQIVIKENYLETVTRLSEQ